jgi:hypothetical protein
MASDDLGTRKTELEDWIDRLGAWMIGFIWPVAVGLFIEFYAVLNPPWTLNWNAFIDRIGLLLVTAGVAGELVIEHKTHSAERKLRGINTQIEHEADLTLKAADERIAELNLARAKIEQRMSARVLTAEGFDKLIKILKPQGPKLVDIIVFDHHIVETKLFATQVSFAFISSGWHCHVYESRAAKYRIVGPSLVVAVAKDHESEYRDLADTLASAINGPEIDCVVRLSSFGFSNGREFNPGEFELTSVHPVMVAGARNLSPFRLQIGAKQLATYPPSNVAIARPATPTQA